jgi:hypothetical protein
MPDVEGLGKGQINLKETAPESFMKSVNDRLLNKPSSAKGRLYAFIRHISYA